MLQAKHLAKPQFKHSPAASLLYASPLLGRVSAPCAQPLQSTAGKRSSVKTNFLAKEGASAAAPVPTQPDPKQEGRVKEPAFRATE
jgi:hypothetical protein